MFYILRNSVLFVYFQKEKLHITHNKKGVLTNRDPIIMDPAAFFPYSADH